MAAYTVKPGDNLSNIAAQYKVPVSSLSGFRSGNPNLIFPGEQINIGQSAPNQTPSTPQYSPVHPMSVAPQPTTPMTPVPNPKMTAGTQPNMSSPVNWVNDAVKKVSDTVVPQAFAEQAPPPRKTFNTNAHPDAISSPGFVNGTPDWVKDTVKKAADKYNIPTALLSALLKQESGFNPNATSPVGAQGIAQFMPGTAKGMGVDTSDPVSSIMGAAKLLRQAWDQFGKPELALAAYNAGGGAVNQFGGIPPYKETQDYVKNIMAMAGEVHQSANGPILNTINEIKKNAPKASPSVSRNPNSLPQNPNIVSPLPQNQVVTPPPPDPIVARIRRAKPHISLSDQQIKDLYNKYGDRLLAEIQ